MFPTMRRTGIGNVMRHNYEDVNLEIIIGLRGQRLSELLIAVSALLEKHDPEGQPFFDR